MSLSVLDRLKDQPNGKLVSLLCSLTRLVLVVDNTKTLLYGSVLYPILFTSDHPSIAYC